MKPRILIILALLLFLFPRAGLTHEFWIEARKHQVAKGEKIEAGVFNGQNFQGVEMAWFPPRIVRSGWEGETNAGPFDSGPGDRPAIHMTPGDDGLHRLIYEAAPSSLTYTDWDKFKTFAEEKGNAWAIDRHTARGLPETGFTESFRRFCKALVAVGDGTGNDAYSGMEIELVALDNPYIVPHQTGLQVELRYLGEPLPDTTITVFEKWKGDTTQKFLLRTDITGRVHVPLLPGKSYLLDAVVLREAEGQAHVWESLWASLTFAVPQ
ncbi:DUF4198 domain-containing protein [Alisedimentitalea sp. MJ-SS2]|uniref:DUF4198 domain-containing protein n=1 Tax=Aliisedimentitalea sp. MJ-SS2 TaxID=3049795 RepID=UPI002912D0EF|nr:DUF4198 domain-containing protein [Alisedimentitalea sp. MJ-SS2]MDU8926942.1 DUF4198 domain-containing protein [Alisedimentitalea sp. MJ-SS2]